uniref:Metalloendopeptidase n=1 Tax=Timema californicum TaxID=61474 RepID=A0A7R9PFD4_TIMCA|nr:unnamed protein product [Timema californicum]
MIRNEESLELGLPYDYESVMHYQSYAYSKNGNATVVQKIPGVNMGQREKLSDIDIELLRLAYNCQNIPSRMVRTNPGAAHRPWRPSRRTSPQGKI